jgi:dUTP pyrophosphatase
MTVLKAYKVHKDVVLPKHATQQSACFDLAYQPLGKGVIFGMNRTNGPFTRPINLQNGTIKIAAGERAMIPTGLRLDIPEGYSVRIHPRSGLSYKSGIVLANCEGVIDSDYFDEIFVLIHNTSEVPFVVTPGDRVAQAELVKVEVYSIEETLIEPAQKTDRAGGMGSTGVNTLPPDYNGISPMVGPDGLVKAIQEKKEAEAKKSQAKKKVDKPVEA